MAMNFDMKVKRITQNNIEYFRNLFAPEVADLIAAGAPITALGAFSDGICHGAIAGALSDDYVFTILSLYVAPSARRKGAGTLLIESINNMLIPFSARVEIEYNELEMEQEILTEFLLVSGYEFDSAVDAAYFMTTLDKILESPVIKSLDKDITDGEITPFESVLARRLTAANDNAEKKGAPVPEGGLAAETVDKDISMAYVKDDEVQAYIAIEKLADDLLDVSAVYDGKGGPVVLIAMIKKALKAAAKRYSPATKVVTCAINDSSEKLMDQLFDGNVISRKLYRRAEPLFSEVEIERFIDRTMEADEQGYVNMSDVFVEGDISEFTTPGEADPDDIFADIEYDPDILDGDEKETVYIGKHGADFMMDEDLGDEDEDDDE